MERAQTHFWARLLLPLGAALPGGCDALTAPSASGPQVAWTDSAEFDDHESLGPLRRIAPPVVLPVDVPGPSDRAPHEPWAAKSAPLADSEDDAPQAGEPVLTSPTIRADDGLTTLTLRGETQAAPLAELHVAAPAPAPAAHEQLAPLVAPLVALPDTAPEPIPLERSQLPWARPKAHPGEMAVVITQAHELNQKGFALANRGAMSSARLRFHRALTAIAEALDTQQETTAYSKALTAGLIALDEATDFGARRAAPQREFDVSHVIAGHKTPILKDSAEGLTPLIARQRYYTFAQEQLALAAGQEPAGSEALFALGKVAVAEGRADDRAKLDHMARAMVCYQAALLADGRNFRAANELGVLMVEAGRPERARDLFAASASLAPHPATWQNLAIAEQRLGHGAQANLARRQAETLARASQSHSRPQVEWLDANAFARSSAPGDGLLAPTNPAPASNEQSPEVKSVVKRNVPTKTAEAPRKSWFSWR